MARGCKSKANRKGNSLYANEEVGGMEFTENHIVSLSIREVVIWKLFLVLEVLRFQVELLAYLNFTNNLIWNELIKLKNRFGD